MITRAANLLGVYLGPEEHLMEPKKDNPTGFWEHQLITDLNDEILLRLGGTWADPPTFPKGWERSPKLADLRRRARRIIREDFRDARLWGWKDPRTCLTLPFWQKLLPRMRYVICLRNPVDVASSLEHRNGFPLEKSASLWLSYLRSALEHTVGETRLCVFYEDFVANWQRELRYLSGFVGSARQAGQPNVKKAVRRFARADLQHHRTEVAEVIQERDLPFPPKALYAVLRVYVSLREDRVNQRRQGYRELQDTLNSLSRCSAAAQYGLEQSKAREARQTQDLLRASIDLESKAKEADALKAFMDEQGKVIQHLESKAKEAEALKAFMDEQGKVIRHLDELLKREREYSSSLRTKSADLQNRLSVVLDSKTWKILSKMGLLKD